MADSTSRDNNQAAEQARIKGQEDEKQKQMELEKAKEQARIKGQEDEKQKQMELEKAKEQSRKQAIADERARQKAKGSSGASKIIMYLIIFFVLLAAIVWFTMSVTVITVAPGISKPFTSSYGVSFPEGQTITIGNTHIIVLSNQGLIITDIDGEKQNMVVGEDRVIADRRATITTLGGFRIVDTDLQMNLKYKGERDNRAYFDVTLYTSKQVPDIVVRQLIPREVDVRPI